MANATPAMAPVDDVKVEAAKGRRARREITEDMTATEVNDGSSVDMTSGVVGSPDAVWAELEKVRAQAVQTAATPVNPGERQTAAQREQLIADNGGMTEDGILRFGEKVFHADPDLRKPVPRDANLAAGPRVTRLPESGEFLPSTRSFRDIPYRTGRGSIRVDR